MLEKKTNLVLEVLSIPVDVIGPKVSNYILPSCIRSCLLQVIEMGDKKSVVTTCQTTVSLTSIQNNHIYFR